MPSMISVSDALGKGGREKRRLIAVALLLFAAICGTFAPTLENGFVIYDDRDYLTENPVVQRGLTWPGVKWAFSSTLFSNWHPLTWLSHMGDVSLFGMAPGRHHLVSLLFHAANTVLLFLFLRRITGALWRSAAAAALFGLHPLHVESVAWAAERKDVLALFFGLLSLVAYDRFLRKPAALRYLPALVLFALGLLAKPILVTLPFVLFLLDYWPFGRWSPTLPGIIGATGGPSSGAGLGRCLVEKIPFFGLASASSLITYAVQARSGAVNFGAQYPIPLKAANAVVAYVKYLGMTVFPRGLAVIYPFPERYPAGWILAGALLLLGAASWLALRSRARHPFLIVGWLWYLVTLVPVIGLVQIGLQGLADRYTYLPLIGIFLLLSWGAGALFARDPRLPVPLSFLALAALGLCAFLARAQVRVWRDSLTLFSRAVAVTSGNWVAENNLGNVLALAGREEEATAHYRAALAASPHNAEAHYNLAHNLESLGRREEAIGHYRAAISCLPSFAPAHYNLGLALALRGGTEEAAAHFRAALHIDPALTDAHLALADALAVQGAGEEAVREYRSFLGLRPRAAPVHVKLGDLLLRQRRFPEAKEAFLQALAINPNLKSARDALQQPALR